MKVISHEPSQRQCPLFDNSLTENTTLNGFSKRLIIEPGEQEIFIFEWEKSRNDVRINVNPKFKIEEESCNFLDRPNEKPAKNRISNDIVYYDVRKDDKIYIVISNSSKFISYGLKITFKFLENIILTNHKLNSGNKISIYLKVKGKEIIDLKVINKEKPFNYKLDFTLDKF
jgi:hypothetical protein